MICFQLHLVGSFEGFLDYGFGMFLSMTPNKDWFDTYRLENSGYVLMGMMLHAGL